MTTSTSFAQMANNQSISLSSALRANTPPTKGQTTSRKFLTLSIFLFLSFFTTNLWGADTWTLVTDASTLKAGDKVVIVASSADYALSTTQNSNNRGQASVTKNNTTKTVTWTGISVQELTLETGTTNGTWAFNTGSGYLFAASSSKNYLRTEETLSANSSWSINIASTGVATIKATGSNTRNWLRYNSSSSIFSCYSSGQGDVCIYKKVVPVAPQTIDVTLYYKGTSTTISSQTSPYTLPTTGDYVANACDGWEFAGWYGSEYAKSETEPTYITQLTSTGDAYAVYSHTETTQGGGSTPTEVSKTYTFSDYEEGEQYAEETYELDDDVTINITGCHINTQLRVYGGQPGIVISEELPGRIVSMGFNMGYKADKLVVSGSTNGSSWTEVGNISTTTNYEDYTLDFGETNYTYFKLNVNGSSQIRIAKMSITYESTSGGGGSTTYYHSTPDCGSSCTPPESVTISGSWDRFGGETISLTATPKGGTGDYSYQWQKYYDGTWNNITNNTTATTANLVYENCDGSHSGTYRCVVSTGAGCSTASNGFQVKVYTLECYNNGTNIYHFTRNGDTQSGTLTLKLNASTAYKFQVHVDNDYYGNDGTINKDETNWVLGAGLSNLTVNSGLGGTFTFTIDYSTNGNNNTLGVPEISVTYPRKTIYLNPGVWDTGGAQYAIYYFIDGHNAWSDLLVGDACGTYTTIPQWNGVTMIAVRLSSDATEGTWDKKWNQTGNIPVNNNDYIAITEWGNIGDNSPHTYSTYTPATYSITFNGNGNTGGSMTEMTGITCGGSATLTPNTFTRTGYTFAGWATSDNGEKVYDDKATISNITSNITLYAKWTPNANTAYTVKHYKQKLDETYSDTPDETDNLTGTTAASVTPAVKSYEGFTAPSTKTVTIAADGSTVVTYQYTRNSYTLTWNLDGGTISTQGTATGEVKYGAALTAPIVTKTGYTFAGWSPAVAATMPAAKTTYTAQWTKVYTITWKVGGNEYTTGSPTTSVESNQKISSIPAAPDDNTLADCGATKFMGWSIDNIGSTPDADAPTDLFTTVAEAQNKIGNITENKIFYAVFATEESSNTTTTSSTTISGDNRGTIANVLSWSSSKNDGTAITAWSDDHFRLYPNKNNGNGSSITITPVSGVTISEVVLTATSTTYAKPVKYNIDGGSDISGTWSSTTMTISDINATSSFKFRNAHTGANNDQLRVNIEVTYSKLETTTTYSNYVTQCCTDWTPTLTYSKTTLDSESNETAIPTITGNIHSAPVSFESSNESVLTVDANNGTITAVGAGKATITATWDATGEYCDKSITTDEITVNGNFLVTFHANDGSGNTTTQQIPSNTATALKANTFQRDGYTFQGWARSASGAKEYDDGQEVTLSESGLDLYAVWQVKTYEITIGTITGNGTITTSPANSANCDAQVTITDTPAAHYTLTSVVVTRDDNSQTVAVGGNKFTMPASDVTITAVFTENEKFAINYTIPIGGGILTDNAPTTIYIDGSITLPGIKDGTISSEYSCERFIGWTTEEPNGEGLWDGTPTIYDSGTSSEAITANTTFYAVYQRSGGGASGSVQLTNTKIATRGYDADESSITEEDGSVWGIKCYVGNSSGSLFMQLKDGSYYIKTPTVAGNITSLTINYTAVSSDSRTIYFNTEASKDGAVTHQFNAPSVDPSSGNHDYTWDVSAANTKTGYILASSTFKINSIKLDYGPAPIISHSLQCGCAIDEFDLTYDANETNFPNSTTNCEGVTGYKFSEHEDKYTICSSVPTLDGYKFIGWTTNANGSGDLYTSGQEIKCVPSSDITLYAQYERVYTVIFDNQNTINATTQTESGAAVDVPTATEPCGSEWQFVGWSTEEIAPMSLKPTITIEPGTNTYIPEGNVTLYAIYQKTSLSKEFVAGKTGAYKISNGSDKYASSFYNGRLNSADNLAEATTYYITYTASDDGKYTIQQADGLYIAYSGESTSLEKSEEPYYWKITKDGELWQVATIPAGRYLKYSTEFRAYTEAGNIGLIATEGQYYYRTMSCDDNFDITFNNQNGAIIHWQNGYPQAAYQDLEGGTTITTFPMASYEGWTFIGWRAQEYEESTSAPESSSVYGGLDGISGNALTITADVTMYPVFTQFLDNDPFDEVNGGDYYMYYIADGDIDTSVDEYGAANRIYAGEYNDYSFRSTQSCADATLFTFAKLPNGKWTIYDNTRDKFVYGVNNDNKLEDKAQTADGKIKYVKEWTIEVNKGNQVNAVSVDGYILSALTQDAKSGTFKNYDDDNLTKGKGYQYHRVYLGSCTERVFTTAPSTEPIITLNGDVKVTSTATQSVKAASVLTVSASNIATSNLSITSDNAAFIVSPTTITVVDKKVGVTPITITYNPTITSDGTETATITVSDGNEASESITVTGRHLPENFVIAAKWGDNWYAMPANMNSQSSTEGLLIEVDDPAANPTKALSAPNTTKYGLKSVYTSNSTDDRFENYGERLVFVENVTEATPVANKTLYNGGGSGTSNTNIQVYAQYTNYYNDDAQAPRYEWTPTTTNLQDYTLTSAHQFTKDAGTLENARTVSLDNHGMFGTLLQDKSYNGMVRLLPVDNFYAPAELQVVEWKQNSVSVMYTGAGSKATTKVGSNKESDVQLLSDKKIDHAVYSLSTADLTTATNQPLIITIKDDAEATIGAIKLTIPAIVATNKSSTELGVTEENAKATSIVVLSDATLTASTTKYTYDDVVVYPGGKLVIGNSGKLGMYTLTLRLGSSWGAAEYEYKYPQFVLNTTTDGAYSNTSGQINLDYVTTKDQYYTFVAPFEVKTKDIKYPIDIYGTNVATNNSGSFEFEYYDGAARAAGNTGWTTVEEDPEDGATLTPGQGYTFLGMPKKVSVNGATSTRQTYGIHRIPMKVAASVAQTHETTNQAVPLAVTLAEKDNDSGWNIVGNPYMSEVTGLTNDDIQVGELVHTNDANGNWTGKWHWDNPTTGQRFLVMPSNDGQSYEAVQASNATLHAFKHFFVQINNKDANAMSIPVANRVDRNLAPARYAQAEIEKDIEIAVQMTGDKLNDQMDFLINDIYSTAFEKNADFTKMMNATNFNIYGVHVDNNLSFVALDKAAAMQSVAIGFQVPKAGEYQLSLSDKPYVMADKIEALFVTDHEASPEVTTNLVDEDYTFYVNQAETNNTRFTVSIILKPEKENTPTGVDNINTKANQPIKFLYQDKIYILRNGMIYDTTGKQVITINK